MPKDSAQTRPPVVPAPETGAGPSKTRWVVAFLVAAASDVMSYGTALVPPVQWGWMSLRRSSSGLLGWRWALLPGLVAEAIPGWLRSQRGCWWWRRWPCGARASAPVGGASEVEERKVFQGDDVPGVLLIMSFAQPYQAVESMYQHMCITDVTLTMPPRAAREPLATPEKPRWSVAIPRAANGR